jgi:TPR repeat protein
VLIALAVAGYVYRQEVGQFMIQTGQRISGPAESANSARAMQMPRSSSPENAASTSQGNSGEANRAEAGPSTIPLPGSSVPTSSSSGSSAAAGTGNAAPLTTGPESTTPRSGDAGSMATPSYVSPGRKNSSAAVPVSPLMTGGNPNTVGDPNSESGQTEYLQAVQILRSRKSREDQADAARLLWIAVEKGNSNAEVALAELYRLGQGVGQNCDQARVLLTAAARKGNPEGVRHLQLFEQAGCE